MTIDPRFFNGLKALVLLDLDGTVLDEQNRCSAGLVPALQAAHAAGIQLGWASSTSDKGLGNWEQLLDIPPGLLTVRLSEDGVRITGPPGMLPDNGEEERSSLSLLADVDRWKAKFAELRGALRTEASKARWGFVETHPSTWAERVTTFGPGHEAVLAVDVTRVASFTAEVRRVQSTGALSQDRILTARAHSWVRDAATRLGIPTKLLEHGTGWIDLSHPSASKAKALLELRALVPANVEIVLVGNGRNDVVQVDGVTVVAVANADKTLKRAASLVTRSAFSEGVVEYLATLEP